MRQPGEEEGSMSRRFSSRRGPRPRRGARAARLALALAAAAAAFASSAAGASSHASAAASGCGHSVSSGSTTLQVRIGGRSRTVIVHVPSGYAATKPAALVLNLHGSGSDAHQQELFSGMDATADADGFIVAYPQALIPMAAGFDWNIPGVPLFGGAEPPAGAANDVSFLTDLVQTLAGRYCIDTRRVYSTGVSGGGRMSSQLACDAPSTFAAVAPVAGLRYPSPCPTRRNVAIIAFHGSADPIDPYNGHGQPYWTYSVPVAAQRWATHDGCKSTAKVTHAKGYTLSAYSGCAAGSQVELYTLAGEGHEWPGGPPLPSAITRALGPQSDAVNANAAMWAFFQAHPAK
jgi:polyhydroxybutyrate depolymerase